MRRGPAGAGVDQHGLPRLQIGQTHEHPPGGEPVDRNRRGVRKGEFVGNRPCLTGGNTDHVRVPPESGGRNHPIAVRKALDPFSNPVHGAGHLIAHDARQRRRVLVEPHPGQNVGEIDARRADPDPDFAGLRFGIRRLPHFQYFWPTVFWYPHLPHFNSPNYSIPLSAVVSGPRLLYRLPCGDRELPPSPRRGRWLDPLKRRSGLWVEQTPGHGANLIEEVERGLGAISIDGSSLNQEAKVAVDLLG